MVIAELQETYRIRSDSPSSAEIIDLSTRRQPPRQGFADVRLADALDCYDLWPQPTVIVSDGAYGVGGFPGDPPTPAGLETWYEPHAAAWSRRALPETSLWFWGTEVGWATVHPLLVRYGWEYRTLHIWDKSNAHIAGNVNSKTIRRFPIVTEVCAHYVRDVKLPTIGRDPLPIKEWLRHEWQRSGLPLSKTNEACGVKNAATRKYFTQCHLWYFPPPEMMVRLAAYANIHGRPTQRPYFSIDGRSSVSAEEWVKLRSKWNHTHGLTNVWQELPIRGQERLKSSGAKVVHLNQKPLVFMERIIRATSDPGDVIWEPFGGLCSAAVAAIRTGRHCYGAEIIPEFHKKAVARVQRELEEPAWQIVALPQLQ
jgi:hypothetical protein